MTKEQIENIINENNTPIVTNKLALTNPTFDVEDIKFGEDIAAKLFRVLFKEKTGVGLSANQIGINKSVCVVNVKKPYYFINPKIVETSGEFVYLENCLSFPGETVRTKRYSSITIECDNYESQLYWDVSDIVTTHNHYYMDNLDVLECVAIQHEIDHLMGKTMYDREYISKPIKSSKTYNRNDKVIISNGIDELVVKFKKFESDYKDKDYQIIDKI